MNIVYACSHEYLNLCKISAVSVMDSNKNTNEINFYILINDFSDRDKHELSLLVNQYNRSVFFIDMSEYSSYQNKFSSHWSDQIFYRLFASDKLPEDVKSFLMLGCDTLILDDITSLFSLDISDTLICGVPDFLNYKIKDIISLNDIADEYLNADVLLINSQLWKQLNISKKICDLLDFYKGNISYADQTTINLISSKMQKILPLKFNFLIPYFCLTYKQVSLFSNSWINNYCTPEEYDNFKRYPSIIHITGMYVKRPWDGFYNGLFGEKYLYFQNEASKIIFTSFNPAKKLPKPFYKKIFYLQYLLLRFVSTFCYKINFGSGLIFVNLLNYYFNKFLHKVSTFLKYILRR